VRKSVRAWDKAGTEREPGNTSGAATAGVLMHVMKDGTYCISHIARGHWSALERERKIRAWAESDVASLPQGHDYRVIVEMEPGSGGKESAENTVRSLAGFRVYADKPTGAKEVRAEPFAAQVQQSNVFLIVADWNRSWLEECEAWPHGKQKDQVDAAAMAFSWIAVRSSYVTPGSNLKHEPGNKDQPRQWYE
jgi:predicted phage terminase large subunit-like protein